MRHVDEVWAPFEWTGGRGWAAMRGGRLTRVRLVSPKPPAGANRDDAALARFTSKLARYFAGGRVEFGEALDVEVTPFARRVMEAVRRIPPGQTRTYGEVAKAAGSPRAARAVGRVMAANPVPIVVPCHRVVASTGLGGFTGGLHLKRALLGIEGARG